MNAILRLAAAGLSCSTIALPAYADVVASADPTVDEMRTAMQSARWTGPMLASNAETLPKGHFYTEPYFFDVISGGDDHFGISGYYQYGLADDITVGLQPFFGYDGVPGGRHVAVGDLKLLSQFRLSHFTPEHRVPSVSVVLQEIVPIGKYDRLEPNKNGSGSGSFATEVGVNIQHWFVMPNGRPLRARLNLLQRFPHGAHVEDRSVYGTGPGFSGRALPAKRSTVIAAVEYSISREWAVALDVMAEWRSRTTVSGRYDGGPKEKQVFPHSSFFGVAPAIEYNMTDRTGVLFGVWVIPKGHNTPSSVTPAIAISQFW